MICTNNSLVNFNGYPQNLEAYGGQSGHKIGILYEGNRFIIKYPGQLKGRNLKNVEISYSNSPISEYIGSHIYEYLGIPVHETVLGERNGKIVVGCKDFREKGDELIEFGDIKVTLPPEKASESDKITNGTGTELGAIINVMREHPMLQCISGVEERFWDMFVIDALIGNPDRNNGNWGIIKDLNDNLRIAPVYDNGNSFGNKLSERQMARNLENPKRMKNLAYIQRTCVFKEDGHLINPYQFIQSHKMRKCDEAVLRLVPKMNLEEIEKILLKTPAMTEINKKFCQKLVELRYYNVLQPALEQIQQNKGLEADVGERKPKKRKRR